MNPKLLPINAERTAAELAELAGFSQPDTPPPAVTRVLYTPPDRAARVWLNQRFAEADLRVRADAVGNTFARWVGSDPSLPAVATGSHIDAIPHSGRYDGTVGVLGALEAVRALQAVGFRPRRSVEIVHFTSEEPTRFGLGCLGSRLMSGALSASAAAQLRDGQGVTLDQARSEAGFAGDLASVRLPVGHYAGFVELHIEQGPLLERAGTDIGAVTAIAAPATLRVGLDGVGGHAGALLMPDRRDALCAAAEIVLAVERAARATGAVDTVATTGVCRVHPGAVNSVPSRVELEIDIRDIDGPRRDGVLHAVQQAVLAVGAARAVSVRTAVLNADPPATADAALVAVAEAVATEAGLSVQRMVSRAYHDSLFLARLAPTTMIFIPCRAGVSHRPDEYSSPAQVAAGVRVVAGTLARLAL